VVLSPLRQTHNRPPQGISMIFLSAQPDEPYFLWQLQLQLYNFRSLGLDPESIHVLIGYNPRKKLNEHFQIFIKTCKEARFFAYPDTRQNSLYLSSIRPHLIRQHFQHLPGLQTETIFYHDSDIVFQRLPDFQKLDTSDIWYASDTSAYLSADYIKRKTDVAFFKEMCDCVGIQPEVVEAYTNSAGGAQYLIKKVSIDFWGKLESDCENLFRLLKSRADLEGFCIGEYHKNKIQSWCADMWALWWNALLAGKTFMIHKELNFCWANSTNDAWNNAKILHYTGRVSKDEPQIFRKENYISYPPYYENLSKISPDTCSYYIKTLIDDYRESKLIDRTDLRDVTFLIPVRIDSEDRLENLITTTTYIHTSFNTSIMVLEVDENSLIDKSLLPRGTKYYFIRDSNTKLHRTKYHNWLIEKTTTPLIALYDADVILPVHQIVDAIKLLRDKEYAIVSPYDGAFLNVDGLLKVMFLKLMDPALFETHQRKMAVATKRSWGGCVLIDRDSFVDAGMENENISSWGPDDVERIKRMEILGYKVKRIPGNLYHLPHKRGVNSKYSNQEERCTLLSEYLKICSFKTDDLRRYINTWVHRQKNSQLLKNEHRYYRNR
jgi:hypothetical protein